MSQNGADWIAKVTGKTKDIRILTVRFCRCTLRASI